MDKLDAMQVYVAVVDAHSFARAAEVLGQPRSTVSRVVKELEAWLGAQLLQRTTRKLSVTAEGRRYYEECKRLLAEMAAMEASFPGRSAQPAGRFKVGMPQSLARHCILPRIGEFLQQYPDLELILCSSDNVEDIIQEGFDCVIRTGGSKIPPPWWRVLWPATAGWSSPRRPGSRPTAGRRASTNCTSIGRWAT
ncbi:LysR family transcriptional regulator [Klebsiella pneumoniae]|uniref:LysR family transcriptional regulator n=1 Tax=Klebsiella pneumoniae TaxID=573 RepID=A0AB74GSX3_KLEPN|nr:LysR family transcriptional regulator [Klebsiella pneumoniae]